jgi:hypothetical protein
VIFCDAIDPAVVADFLTAVGVPVLSIQLLPCLLLLMSILPVVFPAFLEFALLSTLLLPMFLLLLTSQEALLWLVPLLLLPSLLELTSLLLLVIFNVLASLLMLLSLLLLAFLLLLVYLLLVTSAPVVLLKM